MIELYTTDYRRRDYSPAGGIVKSFVVGEDCGNVLPGTYGDMRTQHWVWQNRHEIDIVGFQHYRKHFNFATPADWMTNPVYGQGGLSFEHFRDYQRWLNDWSGDTIVEMLGVCDVIVTNPFDVSYNENDTIDFCRTRSGSDWAMLVQVMERHFAGFDYRMHKITCHNMFIMKAKLFREYMEFWWHVCQELRPLVTGDGGDTLYKSRMMAVLSERIFNLWLHWRPQWHGVVKKQLKVLTCPMVVCWGLS